MIDTYFSCILLKSKNHGGNISFITLLVKLYNNRIFYIEVCTFECYVTYVWDTCRLNKIVTPMDVVSLRCCVMII